MTASRLSYTSGTAKQPLLGMTIGEMLDITADRFPDREALIVRHQSIRWSWRKLREKTDACARALLAIGVEQGDRIGIWSPNRAEWTLTQLAAARIGAILVNINPAYRAPELKYAMNLCAIRFLVTAEQFKHSDYIGMLQSLLNDPQKNPGKAGCSKKVPTLETIITLSDTAYPGMSRWQDVMDKGNSLSESDLEQRQQSLQFDDPINIQYTSGTTGHPKGVTLTHHNILNNAYFVARQMRLTEQDRLVVPVPLYHCFGMVLANLACLTCGATLIYPSEGFDASQTLTAVAEEKATALHGVPTMFIAELHDPDFASYDLSSLRTGIIAGSLCPVELMKRIINDMHLSEIQIGYGMTETSPISTQTSHDTSLEQRVTTVGRTQPHQETKIITTDNQHIVPRGQIGELCTRGYSVMMKYWGDEEATDNAIDEAGWMHSGDLALMDDDGFIQIIGRIKDMVIRGGENIYPKEIEDLFYTHPAVAEIHVTGVPDPKYGEAVIAWIRLKDGVEQPSEESLRDFCQDQIAHFKIPRYFKFTDSFPMTITGKVQKYKIREISTQELGLGETALPGTAI
ncbi:AMP-binding protein [Kistimonas scapharcae]|uniref:AMP-binding protein n=1 Tax=Kistimonas scapharcae TaxID=1036133 RepID=A0ABP8V836_9GAMM